MFIEFTDNSTDITLQDSGNFILYFDTELIEIILPSTELIVSFNNTNTIDVVFDNILRATSEDETMYSKRIDFITDNLLYRGEAVPGSTTNTPVWRIRKITIAGDNDISELWALGNADFTKVWDNRLSYTYI